jgi:hypothetical protein
VDDNQENNAELLTEKQNILSLRKMTPKDDHVAKTAEKQGVIPAQPAKKVVLTPNMGYWRRSSELQDGERPSKRYGKVGRRNAGG